MQVEYYGTGRVTVEGWRHEGCIRNRNVTIHKDKFKCLQYRMNNLFYTFCPLDLSKETTSHTWILLNDCFTGTTERITLSLLKVLNSI